MSAANLAYLALILGAYAIFILVLGVTWIGSALRAPKKPPATRAEVIPAHQPSAGASEAPRRRAA